MARYETLIQYPMGGINYALMAYHDAIFENKNFPVRYIKDDFRKFQDTLGEQDPIIRVPDEELPDFIRFSHTETNIDREKYIGFFLVGTIELEWRYRGRTHRDTGPAFVWMQDFVIRIHKGAIKTVKNAATCSSIKFNWLQNGLISRPGNPSIMTLRNFSIDRDHRGFGNPLTSWDPFEIVGRWDGFEKGPILHTLNRNGISYNLSTVHESVMSSMDEYLVREELAKTTK